jgi:hypothetical protein
VGVIASWKRDAAPHAYITVRNHALLVCRRMLTQGKPAASPVAISDRKLARQSVQFHEYSFSQRAVLMSHSGT